MIAAFESIATGFLASAIRIATPFLFAALGETITERSGIINLGIEGAMLSGALAAALGASAGGPWTGTFAAIAAGAAVSALVAMIVLGVRADQVITGTAATLGAVGITGAIYQRVYGASGVGLSLPTFGIVSIPILSRLPVIGSALFQQSMLTYIAMLLVPVTHWAIFHTRWGLRLRASGESAAAARAAGVRVEGLKAAALIIGGALAGLAGASLVLAQVGTFAERMTAGRGFIAIAIVVLGGWNPLRVGAAALLFGGAMALQYLFQALALGIPYQVFLILPYLLTLMVLAGAIGRVRAPAELGKSSGEGLF
ncbi:MAG: ABC transporter permease [Gemmatimonadota bacterium]